MARPDAIRGIPGRARSAIRRPLERVRTASRGQIWVAAVLACLVLAGTVLRLWFTYAWRPGFLGYPDSGTYLLTAANGNAWADPLRTGGYPLFLEAVHGLSPKLSVAIVLQHVLGVTTALLLFGTVRRLGAPAWAGLLPAAVVLLGGGQVFIEHAVVSEALFTFLLAAALYATARAASAHPLPWALAAGVLCGLTVWVRVVGLVMLPVFVVWLAWAAPGSARRRLAAAGAALLGGAALVLGYAALNDHHTGYFGLTRNHAWQPYARVAPIAKCSAFDPPAGTRFLCEHTPPSRRQGPNHYLFEAGAPAVRRYGGAFTNDYRGSNSTLSRFTRAVVLHQPLDYLRMVGDDLLRYVDPEHPGPNGGLSNKILIRFNLIVPVARQPAPYYTPGFSIRPSHVRRMVDYEEATRLDGLTLVLLVLLAAAAPFVARGRARAGAILLTVVAFAGMVVPVATFYFDARFAIPAFGPLAAAAAFGAWGLGERLRAARRPPAWRFRARG